LFGIASSVRHPVSLPAKFPIPLAAWLREQRQPEQKHPPICRIGKLPYHLAGMDRAFAALMADLDERGLLAQTLVVYLTEFGRTPKINAAGGRDHWGAAGSIFFAGGGARGGQAIGATDRRGAQTVTPPWSPSDVAATVYQAIGIRPTTSLYDRQNRPIAVLPEGRPITGVL
jgi:arylsulfatase A-like enzyme